MVCDGGQGADRCGFLAVLTPETEGVLLDAFLPVWMAEPGVKRSLRLNFPARKTNHALETHWFKPNRTLIWMKYQG